jgi:hypothetical protein
LKALVEVNDGAGDWHIAVRSGGHSSIGSSNINHGVTIDLSMMNSSVYDDHTKVASIEPGGRWMDVYSNLEKYGVTVAGGRDGGVGVGGFLLGGGISFFSGRMGFGCDTVMNYEVVLANGSVINANSETHADLWRTLKGGGSNFGIVTRFDMEVIPSRNLYYDFRLLSIDYSDALIDALIGFADQEESLADNNIIVLYTYNTTVGPGIYTAAIYVNTNGDGNSTTAFEKIRNLPALTNFTTLQTMAQAAAGSQLPGGTRLVCVGLLSSDLTTN